LRCFASPLGMTPPTDPSVLKPWVWVAMPDTLGPNPYILTFLRLPQPRNESTTAIDSRCGESVNMRGTRGRAPRVRAVQPPGS
jgi:hypothetical protein